VRHVLSFFQSLLGLLFFRARRAAKSLSDETVLITGAGRGIGRQLALHLADEANGVKKIVCWDLDAEGCEETARNKNSHSLTPLDE
jgi:NAD(P)-dependent dehydrogenase (short-subunit alcohol dehydrogenase family)